MELISHNFKNILQHLNIMQRNIQILRTIGYKKTIDKILKRYIFLLVMKLEETEETINCCCSTSQDLCNYIILNLIK